MSAARRKVNLAEILAAPAHPEETPAESPAPPAASSTGEGPQSAAPTVRPPSAGEEPAPRRRGRPRTRPASEQSILVLWLPTTLHARLKAVAATKGSRMLDVILDALDATTDDELVQLVQAGAPQLVKVGRFERKPATATAPTEPRKQVTVRGALPSQLEVIDELVTTTGATSRSALLTVVLDHALPARPRALR